MSDEKTQICGNPNRDRDEPWPTLDVAKRWMAEIDKRGGFLAALEALSPDRIEQVAEKAGRRIPQKVRAKMWNMSLRQFQQFRYVARHGIKELCDLYDQHTITLGTAADIAHLSPDEQQDVIERTDGEGHRLRNVASNIRFLRKYGGINECPCCGQLMPRAR